MKKQHSYEVTVRWIRNPGEGLGIYIGHDSDDETSLVDKEIIKDSANTLFDSDKCRNNPEELYVAALSGCHMLWYLHLCAEAGVVVEEYVDEARGKIVEEPKRRVRFSEILLSPAVTVSRDSNPVLALRLHEQARELCFFPNSMNLPIKCQPIITARKGTRNNESANQGFL